MTLRKYIALVRAGIMESLHFRLGTAVTLFANLIYLVLVYFLWKAVYDSAGVDVVNGMTFTDTMIYLILATALFNFLEMFIVWDMSRSIQSGAIILDLLKPMQYRSYKFWTKGAIPIGLNLVRFLISVVMALVVNFSIEMIVATLCLYTESTWGINIVKETIVLVLSGASIPLAFFPESIRNIISWLPFRAIYDIPLQVLLNKGGSNTLEGLAKMWGMQLGWCVILGLAGMLFWNHAVKKITVNGG